MPKQLPRPPHGKDAHKDDLTHLLEELHKQDQDPHHQDPAMPSPEYPPPSSPPPQVAPPVIVEGLFDHESD